MSPLGRSLLAVLGILALSAFAVPAFAKGPSGTWTINYYSDSGCTTTWGFPAQDGGGFGTGNLSPKSPGITVGDTIYFTISVTGGAKSTGYYYEIDGGNAPWPAASSSAILTTDSTGAGSSGCLSFGPVTQAQANAVSCTVPEKISQGNNHSFDGNIIDHFVISGNVNGNCGSGHNFPPPPPPGVPQFPAGLMVGVAALAPLLLFLRRRAPSVQ